MNLLQRVLAAVVSGVALNANATLIDSFNDPNPGDQTVIDTRTTGLNTAGQGSSYNGVGILGGQRDMYVIKTSGSDSQTDGITASVESGAYSFASTSGHAGVGIIRYDGTSNTGFAQNTANSVSTNLTNAIGSINANGLAATDLTGGSLNRFILDVISADAGFNLTMQVFSSGGTQFSQLTVVALAGPGSYVIPFAAFSGIPALQCAGGVSAGCADFTQVTALQAIINFPGSPVSSLNASFDLLTAGEVSRRGTAPEPGMLSLGGAALLAVAASRRRRKSVA